MEIEEDINDDFGLCKCGEVTTLLAIGKKEFFLSCELCEYRVQNLDLFIKHVYQWHLQEFTQANSRPASTELYDQHSDEEMDNKNCVVKGFENVVIDMDESRMDDLTHMKIEAEQFPEEYVIDAYEEENLITPKFDDAEFLADEGEYNIENGVEAESRSKELQDFGEEQHIPLDDERKFILEFIKLYRELPALWNNKSKYYRDRDIKAEQYNTLLKKYKEMYPYACLQDVKKKINTLRSNYNKQKRMMPLHRSYSKCYYYRAISFIDQKESHSESIAETDQPDHAENLPTPNDAEFLEDDGEYDIENNFEEPDLEEFQDFGEETHIPIDDERQFTLEFIKLYRKLPALWNVKSKYYRDRDIKAEQYNTLLDKYKEMYPDACLPDVKKKINTLRSNYKKEKRMLPLNSSQPKCYYYSAISFIDQNESHSESISETDQSDHVEMSNDFDTDGTQSEEYLEEFKQSKGSKTSINATQVSATQKFNLEFIELYKSIRSLWDPDDPHYSNREFRNINYQVLLEKYKEEYPDAEILDVRKKINCIRTNYKLELKRYENTGVESKAYYFKAMSFLRNVVSTKIFSRKLKRTRKVLCDTEMSYFDADGTMSEEYLEESKQSKENRKASGSEKFNLEFIELYKSFRSLWDPNHPDYKNQHLRYRNYEVLLEKYKEEFPDAEILDVRKKINCIRSNYKRCENTGGESKPYYFKPLSFLSNIDSAKSKKLKKKLCDSGMSNDVDTDDAKSEGYMEDTKQSKRAVQKRKSRVSAAKYSASKNFDLEFEELRQNENTGVESKPMSFLRNNASTKDESEDIKYSVYDEEISCDNTLSEEYLLDGDMSEQEILEQTESELTQSTRNGNKTKEQMRKEKFLLEFIELYKSMPSMWDPNSPGYYDKEQRNINYKILLAKYKEKYPSAVLHNVKRKINILRTNYQKQLKRIASGKIEKSDAYYFNAMTFLQNIERVKSSANAIETDAHDMETSSEIVNADNQSEEDLSDSHIPEDATLRRNTKYATYNKEDEQKFLLEFIDKYQKLPALWNVNSKDYKNRNLKNLQYQSLLKKYKEMYPDADLDNVKRKINTLRSNVWRELKNGPPYGLFYFDRLRFLIDMQTSSEIVNADNQSEEDLSDSHIPEDATLRRNTKYATYNKEDEQKFLLEFIDKYQKLPALWNVNSKDYKNRNLKNLQYQSLLKKYKEMYPDADLDNVKRKINTLRSNVWRELKNGPPYGLFYFDRLRFLIDMQTIADAAPKPPKPPSTLRKDSSLNDEKFILLAKAYESYPSLWNDNEVEYYFSNRRKETMSQLLETFYKISGVKLTKDILDKEISLLRKHSSTEKRRKILCEQQNLSYESQFPFHEHIAFLENYIQPFECSICKQILGGSRKYRIHLASHDGSLPFRCNICGHEFKSLQNLTVHLRRHMGDCTHRCQVCDASFVTTTNFKAHMLTHTGDKPYVCHICGACFRKSTNLKYHLLRHENLRRYKCKICTKAFYNGYKLKMHHAAVHLKVRNIICDVCNKAFATPKHLKQHKHIHNAVKRFVCKFCGKRYTQSSALSGHVKLAHGTKLSTMQNNL